MKCTPVSREISGEAYRCKAKEESSQAHRPARPTPANLAGPPFNNNDGTETLLFRDTVARGTIPRFIRLKITRR